MPSFLLYHRYKILSSKNLSLEFFFALGYGAPRSVHRNEPDASEEDERSEVRNSRPEMAKPAQGTPYYRISSILSRISRSAGSQSTERRVSLVSQRAASCSRSFSSPETIVQRMQCMFRWKVG